MIYGAEICILVCVDRNTINSPIEHGPHSGKGEPWAITRHNRPLTNRQQALLDLLPAHDSVADLAKGDVSMKDLAALTAKTGVEFAMFTRKQERRIIRGDKRSVNIDYDKAVQMKADGYKWSGHTHTSGVIPSNGDKDVLRGFGGKRSVIYDAMGNRNMFTPF